MYKNDKIGNKFVLKYYVSLNFKNNVFNILIFIIKFLIFIEKV